MPNDPGQEIAPTQNRGVAAAFQTDLDAYTPNLMQALPAHVSVDKFKRVLITAVSSNPDLLYANRRTLFTAAVKCASDGLLPDGREAALVVYKTKVKQRDPQSGLDKELYIEAVQYMPMVAGIRKRMRNTGDVLSADAHVVYEKDHFKFKLGDDGFIDHEPAGLSEDPGKALGAYAIIKLKSGEVLRDVLRLADIEKARNVSRAKNGPMWTQFWDEAARKTALRRCSKAAPQSAELEALLNREDEPAIVQHEIDALPPVAERLPAPVREDLVSTEPEAIEHEDEPLYTVIDLDGVEHGFRKAATAEAALIAVLEAAAKMGPERLEGVWESNGVPSWFDPIEYEKLKAALMPPTEPLPKPRQSRPARETLSEVPMPPPAPPAPVAAPRPAQRPVTAIAPTPPMPAAAQEYLDTDSLAIPPPMRRGEPDWRTWTIALFLPKVRKATDTSALAFLVGDNEDNLTAARAALAKDDLAALTEGIERRFRELEA